ncbi:serine/threonine protein kinase [Pseudocyphellaria aurata]|nr:serine/threonine protein kinase [Pseudocyphellaria aurata]
MATRNDESSTSPQGDLAQENRRTASGTSSTEPSQQPQAVRFASVNQEIEPAHSLPSLSSLPSNLSGSTEFSPEAQEEIRNLSRSLQNSPLQPKRLNHFAFEPVSLPTSRIPSNESTPQHASREATRSGGTSPKPSPLASTSSTPPLTPLSAHFRGAQHETTGSSGAEQAKVHPDSSQISPQVLGPGKTPPGTILIEGAIDQSLTSSAPASRPSSASDQLSTRPTSLSQESNLPDRTQKTPPVFIVGPSATGGESSRSSSGVTAGAVTPPQAHERPLTPLTPLADRDDNPYARSKRPPQSKNTDNIDQRFVFGGKDSRRRSGNLSGASSGISSTFLPRSSSGGDLKTHNKHQSTFSLHSLGGKKDHYGHLHDDNTSGQSGKPHGSMSELKRFFGLGHKSKRSQSPSTSAKTSAHSSGTRTPPHQVPSSNVPFADDHGLQTRYGKFGKVLGAGAGGSVRLMKRSSDGVTFAVKQFRDRHSYETEREYAKKVTAEFCIGSTLHYGNIIETLDIVHEKGHWYEVMEFAPFDLFAIVMTGKMSREEVFCSFLQIVSGVRYLHSIGLAHRDLKLDNVVVNDRGIMKIIDFGSASVFRYPFENDIVLATGIVGSDPYLAPEVYDTSKYDPQPTDIWSLAIIFACMSLRRFPWKAPRLTDNSYKLFASPPTAGTPPAEGGLRTSSEGKSKSTSEIDPAADEPSRIPASSAGLISRPASDEGSNKHHHHHHHHHRENAGHTDQSSTSESLPSAAATTRPDAPTTKPEVIRGPWRLLRLLPRETRGIMGRMLEIQPSNRATLDEMTADPWFINTPVCSQTESGEVVRAPGHEHTLEPGSGATPSHSHK